MSCNGCPSQNKTSRFETVFNVRIESDGTDCDGRYSRPTQELEMTLEELAQRIGFITLTHGSAVTSEAYDNGADMIFASKHEEGFARTIVSFREVKNDI